MILAQKRNELLKENTKVKNWISDWQKNNPYKKNKRLELNEKFKTEFNYFLINGKFSDNTIKIFTI